MKEQYWNYMYQIRFTIFYLDLYAEDANRKNRFIKAFSAIMSSGSIAAWAIWQKLMPVWAIMIAFSQVINAVKEYLPYSTRLKNIELSLKSLKMLYVKIEYAWFKVQSGELSEMQINEFLYELKKEYMEIESQSLNEDVLMPNKKRREKAEKQTGTYFQTYFASRFPAENISR